MGRSRLRGAERAAAVAVTASLVAAAAAFAGWAGGASASSIAAGFPDATTTGVPDGVVLSAAGSLVVTVPGTVLDGLLIGCLDVQADNVTVTNSRIECGRPTSAVANEGANLVIRDSEISGLDAASICVGTRRFTLQRVDVSGCRDGVRADGDVTVTGSYVHDLTRSAGSHNDAVQTTKGNNISITGNSLVVFNSAAADPLNAAYIVKDDAGPIGSVTFSGNYVDGGNYTIYVVGSSLGNLVYRDNVFGPDYRYGPVSYQYTATAGSTHTITWQNNVRQDTGGVVKLPGNGTAIPAAVALSVDAAATPVTTMFSLSSTSGDATSGALTDDAAWLTPSLVPNGPAASLLLVTVDPSTMPLGTSTARVEISPETLNPLVVPVSVTVTQSQGGPPATVPAPALLFSTSADRSAPAPLHGATLKGSAYVFVTGSSIRTMDFFIDSRAGTGNPKRVENTAPYDLMGGTDAAAVAWKTSGLTDGAHSVTAKVTMTDGSVRFLVADVDIRNRTVPPTSTPLPTTTTDTTGGTTDTVATTTDTTTTTGSATSVSTPAAGGPLLQVSSVPARFPAADLAGATLVGDAYVFLTGPNVLSVAFYIDRPSATGTANRIETSAPWDLVGGTASTATRWDTTKVATGSHTVTARVTFTDRTTSVLTSSFIVARSQPTATATTVPTATTSTTAITGTTTAAGASLLVSAVADRSSPRALAGATVSGNAYVFVTGAGVSAVSFYLDKPSGTGTATRVENSAPFDLAGGTTASAVAWDSSKVAVGSHSVTIRVTFADGSTALTTSPFTVARG